MNNPDMPASGMMKPVAWIDRGALTFAEERMRDAPISTIHVPLGNQSRSREMADPVALYAIPPDYAKRIAELEGERDLALAKADEPDEASYNEGVEDGKSEAKGVYANLWHSMVHWLSKRKVIDPDADEWTVQDVLAGLANLESDYASTQRSLAALRSLVTEAAKVLEPLVQRYVVIAEQDGKTPSGSAMVATRHLAPLEDLSRRLNEAVKPK